MPLRNRKIAEFLKEKQLGERGSLEYKQFTGLYNKREQEFKTLVLIQLILLPRVRLPGHQNILPFQDYEKLNNLCAKGETDDAIKSLKGFLDAHQDKAEYSFSGHEMLLSKLIALHDNNMWHANLEPYKHLISKKLQKRIPLITELRKWCTDMLRRM